MKKGYVCCSVGNSENHALNIAFLINGSIYEMKNFQSQIIDLAASVGG